MSLFVGLRDGGERFLERFGMVLENVREVGSVIGGLVFAHPGDELHWFFLGPALEGDLLKKSEGVPT